MPGFTVQRSGYITVPNLFYAVVNDLLANGFTKVFPTSALPTPAPGVAVSPFKVTLQPTTAVDPAFAVQPWRIMLDSTGAETSASGTPQVGDIFIATPLQLTDDGKVSNRTTPEIATKILPIGMLNMTNAIATSGTTDNTNQSFIIRKSRLTKDGDGTASYPMTYRLSVGANGFTLFVWEDASDAIGGMFSWVSVQRSVDHITGAPFITGHAPLFCVFGMNNEVFRFTVREDDILKPTLPKDASINSEDSAAILNSERQVAISESNKYIITFPNNLNTQRYAYTTELDMIAYTSADVVSAYTDVPLTVYGEATPRIYKAMSANGPNNTGMRILMLISGGPMA